MTCFKIQLYFGNNITLYTSSHHNYFNKTSDLQPIKICWVEIGYFWNFVNYIIRYKGNTHTILRINTIFFLNFKIINLCLSQNSKYQLKICLMTIKVKTHFKMFKYPVLPLREIYLHILYFIPNFLILLTKCRDFLCSEGGNPRNSSCNCFVL